MASSKDAPPVALYAITWQANAILAPEERVAPFQRELFQIKSEAGACMISFCAKGSPTSTTIIRHQDFCYLG